MQLPEPVQGSNNEDQSDTGMLRYRTETSDTDMPMPAAIALMAMPNYDEEKTYRLMPLHSSLSHWTIPLKTRIQCLIRYLQTELICYHKNPFYPQNKQIFDPVSNVFV
jgi:hypothetical protein